MTTELEDKDREGIKMDIRWLSSRGRTVIARRYRRLLSLCDSLKDELENGGRVAAAHKSAVIVAMNRLRELREKSGLTLHDIGIRMGYPCTHARKSVCQFLNSRDPRLSMVRRFLKAVDAEEPPA